LIPFPSEELRDQVALFTAVMKRPTVDPWVAVAGAERLPVGSERMPIETDADGEVPPHAFVAVAWKVVACGTGTLAVPDGGRLVPTPSMVTSAVFSEAIQVRTTLSFGQTVLDDEVRVTVGDAHGCFTARVRASTVGIRASEMMSETDRERMDMDGFLF
jgi:hypothetical protein